MLILNNININFNWNHVGAPAQNDYEKCPQRLRNAINLSFAAPPGSDHVNINVNVNVNINANDPTTFLL